MHDVNYTVNFKINARNSFIPAYNCKNFKLFTQIPKSRFNFFLFNMKSLQKFKAQDSIHSVLFLRKQLNHYVKLGMYSNIRMTCIIYVGFTVYIKF